MKKTALSLVILLSITSLYSQNISNVQQRKLFQVIAAVNSLYVDTVSDKKLVESSISGIIKDLDPHTTYTPAEEVQRMREPLEGSFEGIGVQFSIIEDTINVVQTISGTPAEKVGVLPGDQIIYIDTALVAGRKIQNSDVFKKLRGKRGTEVIIKVKRKGVKELLEFKIFRDKIPIYSVDASYMADKNIGYIKINSFGSTTAEEFRKAFTTLKKQGMKDLILSLQMNGGGYLGTAIQLVDEFLGSGKLIVYTQGIHQPRNDAEATSRGNFENGRLVVLVDEYSASASEIVSGAIQDWDRGVVVGRRTFGKGLVQRELNLADGSALRLTTAHYYTPSGRSIQKPYKDGTEKYYRDIFNRSLKGEMMHADSIHFPDSLKFTTRVLKRTVYGGGGIMPDVFVPVDTTDYTDFHRQLSARGIINKFSQQYVNKNREVIKQKYPTFDKFYESFEVTKDMLNDLWAAAEKEKLTGDSTVKSTADLKKQITDLFAKNNRKLDANNAELNKLLQETKTDASISVKSQFEKSQKLIKQQIKAIIAGDIWTVNEFYRVIGSENESLQKAIEILKTPNAYENILKKKN